MRGSVHHTARGPVIKTLVNSALGSPFEIGRRSMGIRCRFGFHKGRWKQTAENCVQARTCNRCGARHTRNFHRIAWTYESSNVIPGTQNCTDTEMRSCLVQGVCACGANEKSDTHHLWTEWGGPRSQVTDIERHCLRCGAQEAQLLPPNW